MGFARKSVLALSVSAMLAATGAWAQQGQDASTEQLKQQARDMMSGEGEGEAEAESGPRSSQDRSGSASRYFGGDDKSGDEESGRDAPPGGDESAKQSPESAKESKSGKKAAKEATIDGVSYGPGDEEESNAGEVGTSQLDVAVGEYNLFKFPSSIKEAILPNDAPVSGKPRYVDQNKGLLLKFKANDGESFQIVATLQDGSTEMISVTPREDMVAQTHKVGDFTTTENRTGLSEQNNPNADYLPVLAEKLQHLDKVPEGFFKTKQMPPERQYEGKDKEGQPVGVGLDPVERLEGKVEGSKVYLDLYHIKTSEGVSHDNIDPSQFWERGVGAATITRDAVDEYFALIMRQAE